MSLFSRANSFLNRTLGSAAGVVVTYTRKDGGVFANITIWPTDEYSEVNQTQGANQVRLPTTERPYEIPAALIAPHLPAKGDRITETIAGVACVFEVMPTDIAKEWVYSDNERTRFRVHTKRVS